MSRCNVKVVHFSSVHPVYDNRIFEKELRTIAMAGYEVVFVVPARHSFVVHNIRIRAIQETNHRFKRFVLSAGRAFCAALMERGDLYHFHDPDLIPWAVLLRLVTGKPVIHDVHENYAKAIASRRYMVPWLARTLGYAYSCLEAWTARLFVTIIAEREYAQWLPNATPILNYPDPHHFRRIWTTKRTFPKNIRVLYTGNLAPIRGADIYPKLLSRLPKDTEIGIVGCLEKATANAMHRDCDDPSRLHLESVDMHVPFSRIVAAYGEEWTVATALFRNDPSHSRKELTKFFEYMAAGLPILCSDFPAWRRLIVDNGVGICVDPEDPDAAATAILKLHHNRQLAREMGARGRYLVRKRFNWRSQAEELLRLYDRTLDLR